MYWKTVHVFPLQRCNDGCGLGGVCIYYSFAHIISTFHHLKTKCVFFGIFFTAVVCCMCAYTWYLFSFLRESQFLSICIMMEVCFQTYFAGILLYSMYCTALIWHLSLSLSLSLSPPPAPPIFPLTFCSQLLCSDSVVNYLSRNFISWAWDLTFHEYRIR